MNENRVEQAVAFSRVIGEMRTGNGKTLSEELSFNSGVSLWDAVISYLALYRFPLLFSDRIADFVGRKQLKYWFRPYRGLAARFRDAITIYTRRSSAACVEWPESTDTVLFLGFVPNFYRDVLRTVAEDLAATQGGAISYSWESKTTSANLPPDGKVVYQSIWDHWDAETSLRSRKMLKDLKVFQKSFFRLRPLEKLNSVDAHLNAFGLKREFLWLFWREFKRLIDLSAAAEHILRKHKPALIISADDADQRCRVFSPLARENGIPTLLVQQGLTEKTYPEWRFFSQDAVAAMGSGSKDDMIFQGVPADKISVTGHPGFDHLALPQPDHSARIREDLGVPPEAKMVLFASQPYYVGTFSSAEIRQEMIRAIVQANTAVKDAWIIVKPHPRDDMEELRRLISKTPRFIMVDGTIDIVPLIKACDVVITFFSTVALQAIYAGKPVINVAFPGCGGIKLYEKSGATWVARSKEEIVDHLRKLTGNHADLGYASREDARIAFLNKTAYLPDGQATKRVVDLALKMVRITSTIKG